MKWVIYSNCILTTPIDELQHANEIMPQNEGGKLKHQQPKQRTTLARRNQGLFCS